MEQESNGERTRRYLAAVSELKSADAVAEFYAPDVKFEEFPNRVAPQGRVRRQTDLRMGFEQARQLLSKQRFEVLRLIESGEDVAAELEWTGVLANPVLGLEAGAEMKAYCGMFLTFREGKIVSQRNYDCYPPFA